MTDRWTTGKSRCITTFLVNQPKWNIFPQQADTLVIFKNGEESFKLFDSMIEKFKKRILFQVVIDSTSPYVSVSGMLEEKSKNPFQCIYCVHYIKHA